jgi:hypothetical protein
MKRYAKIGYVEETLQAAAQTFVHSPTTPLKDSKEIVNTV